MSDLRKHLSNKTVPYIKDLIRTYKLKTKVNLTQRKADLIKLIESTQGRNHLRGAIIRHEHTRKRVKEIMAYAEKLIELLNTELNSK